MVTKEFDKEIFVTRKSRPGLLRRGYVVIYRDKDVNPCPHPSSQEQPPQGCSRRAEEYSLLQTRK